MDDLHKRVESRIFSLENHIECVEDAECKAAWTQEVLDMRLLLKRSAERDALIAGQSDTKRLNFIERHPGCLFYDAKRKKYFVRVFGPLAEVELFKTAREAIDAAILDKPESKQ